MKTRPLRVLIAADDRNLLRDLSRFLTMFGYEVVQAAGADRAFAAIKMQRPDILLIDESLTAKVGLEFCQSVNADPLAPHVVVMWLIGSIEPEEVGDALAAGVEDFLAKPVARGELLARLRAAARSLEHERQTRTLAPEDPQTGLLGRSAFYDLAEREIAAAKHSDETLRPTPVACVVFDIDFFGRVNKQYGQQTERSVLSAIISRFPDWCAPFTQLASFEPDRFAVLLPNYSLNEAAQWADQVRLQIRETEIRLDQHSLIFTASFGVVEFDEEESVSAFITRAVQTLELAKESGRDYVARDGECWEESGVWAQQNTPERWFEGTVARDVMIPCTLWLREEDSMEAAAQLLAQTNLPLLPVVNQEHRLVGSISDDELHALPHGENARADVKVSDAMNICVHRESENAPFVSLMERFNVEPGAPILLVDRHQPTGMVTLGSLAALSHPLQSDTFELSFCESGAGCIQIGEDFALESE